jgi:hypothetical protein
MLTRFRHPFSLIPRKLVVPAGSFIRPIETRKGDTIRADYGAYGVGELLLRLTPP